MTELDKNRLAPMSARKEIYDRIRPTYDRISNKMTREQRASSIAWLNKWLEGEEPAPDPAVQRLVTEEVYSLRPSDGPEKRKQVMDNVYAQSPKLGSSMSNELVKYIATLDNAPSTAVDDAIEAQVARSNLANPMSAPNTLSKSLRDIAKVEKWTVEQVPEKSARIEVLHRAGQGKVENRPLSLKTINELVGEVQTGEWIQKLNEVTHLYENTNVPYKYDNALVRVIQTGGLNWHELYPELVDAIKTRWSNDIPRPKTEDEFKSLRRGALYYDLKGRLRGKP
jgi:hypothetical protein